ncbi:MAG: hypothetical protein ABI606_07815 [Rhodoferax sp.]
MKTAIDSQGMANSPDPLETQMAIGQAHETPGMKTESSSASPAGLDGDQEHVHTPGICSEKRGFSLSTAQRKSIRAAVLARQLRQRFEAGAFAQFQVNRHIHKSLPLNLLARKTILRGFLFEVHHRVALVAYRQALRSVHQLHLTRLVDTSGFFADHCGWYQTFCGLMGWVYAAVRLGVVPQAAVQNTVPASTDSER